MIGASLSTSGAKKPRLPYQQLVILCICRFAEPVSFTSVFPYLFFMIKSFGIDKKDIAYYAGLTAASFSISQFFTAILWGRLSDRIGRKPSILLGFIGTLVSSMAFGFSSNLTMAICARVALGVLNGNVGILRTMVAELVPEKELQPRAFSLMPLVWSIGSILGPIIGGFLSDPVRQYPGLFKSGGLLDKYPFALPNIAVSVFLSSGLILGWLFLEETLVTHKHNYDFGRVVGQKLVSIFSSTKTKRARRKSMRDEEHSPLISSSSSLNTLDPDSESPKHSLPPAAHHTPYGFPASTSAPKSSIWRQVFTFQSTVNIIVYFFIAIHSASFEQLLPIFLSTAPPDPRPTFKHPLDFTGGYGLAPTSIGLIFSVNGIMAMLLQFFVFPPITARFGSLNCLRVLLPFYPLIYALLPYTLASESPVFVYAVVALKTLAGIFAFPCSTILLTNSVSSVAILGTLNGVATSVSALGRTIGPAGFGGLYTEGMKSHMGVLPWFAMAAVSALGWLPLRWLVEGNGLKDKIAELEEEVAEEESVLVDVTGEEATRRHV